MAGRKFKKRRRFGGFRLKAKQVYSRYESVYKFFSVTAVCTLTSSAAYALLSKTAGGVYGILLALFYGLIGVWLGYGIAALWGLFTACERVRHEHSYEATEKYFSLGTLISSVITAFLPAWAVGRVAYRLTATVTSSGTVIYNDASAIPALFGGAFFICVAVGTILWFIPYNKVISVGNVIPLGIGFLIVALGGAVFLGADVKYLTVAFIFFVFCSMAVINQGYLIKIINDSGTGYATPEVRRYNLAATAMAFAMIALAGFLATAVIVGLLVSVRIVFYAVFKNAFSEGGGGSGGSVGSAPGFDVSEKIFGGIFESDGEGNAIFYYVVFLVMIVLFFTVLVIYRKRNGKKLPTPSEILGRIYAFILKLLSAIGVWFNTKTSGEGDIPLEDYTDEELIMDPKAELKDLNFNGRSGARRFTRLMGKCKTEGERLSVCYRAARAEYLKRYPELKKSDTPRAALRKLYGVVPEWEYAVFAGITEAFEAFAYAGREPGDETAVCINDLFEWVNASLSTEDNG